MKNAFIEKLSKKLTLFSPHPFLYLTEAVEYRDNSKDNRRCSELAQLFPKNR